MCRHRRNGNSATSCLLLRVTPLLFHRVHSIHNALFLTQFQQRDMMDNCAKCLRFHVHMNDIGEVTKDIQSFFRKRSDV